MKRIYLTAYFNKNVGDDIFVRMLLRRYPDNMFYICENPRFVDIFEKYENTRVVSKIHWLVLKIIYRITKKHGHIQSKLYLKKSDAVVKIGGSIFIEYDKWGDNWVDYDKPLFIIGANYGPAHTKEFRDLVRKKISRSSGCCFRDTYSYELFEDLGPVAYAPDVVFGFNPYDIIEKNDNPKGVAISVMDFNARRGLSQYVDAYYNSIAYLVDYFIGNAIPVTLLSFCKSEGDQTSIEEICKRSNKTNTVRCVSYNGDLENFLAEIESCDTVIATRFHSMVLGWLMNKNVIPIIYSSKQENVINDIEFRGSYFKVDQIANHLDDIIKAYYRKGGALMNLESLSKRSSCQFAAFDKFCNS